VDTPKQLSLFDWARRAVAAPAKPQAAPVMPDMDTLQRALANVRQELHNLQVMSLRPGQSPERLEMLRKLEVSCRAEVKLRLRAIEYRRSLEGG
jgi:hypothetical protein